MVTVWEAVVAMAAVRSWNALLVCRGVKVPKGMVKKSLVGWSKEGRRRR